MVMNFIYLLIIPYIIPPKLNGAVNYKIFRLLQLLLCVCQYDFCSIYKISENVIDDELKKHLFQILN